MKCVVLSRRDAVVLSCGHIPEPSVIISITGTGCAPVLFAENEQIKAILHLCFNDVYKGGFGAMNADDADSIVRFCLNWLPQTNLLVHCEAGVSRSAGVCAAILKWYEGDDMQIFGNPYYRPNIHCYSEVLKAFERSVDADAE